MQNILFGCILQLPVQNGQPVLTPDVRWTRMLKVLGENRPHLTRPSTDYVLKQEVRAFLAFLLDLGNGEVKNVDVRHGLPFSFEIEERWRG
jgi:hypothetical protein